MKRHYLVTLAAVALAIVLGSGTARADILVLGSGSNTIYMSVGTVGGGSFGQTSPDKLNLVVLPWVYCVDFFDTVGLGATYLNATVTHDGTIAGSSANTSGLVGYTGPAGTLTVVKDDVDVAWLLHNYATAAIGNTNLQIGLQAAIWHEIYGNTMYLKTTGLTNSAAAIAAYNADLLALPGSPTNYVGDYAWLSPAGALHTPVDQGLVTDAVVPDGGVTLMLLGGALVGLETLRRRFRV